jgi:hypothetical protein
MQTREYISEEDVNAYHFVSDSNERIAFVSGYQEEVLINNYFRDFWRLFIGLDAYKVFLLLIRECKSGNDYCSNSVKNIASYLELNENTVRKAMKNLEKYDFIHYYYVINKSQNSQQQGLLIKVRHFLNFLSEVEAAQLDSYYRKMHDDVLKQSYRS